MLVRLTKTLFHRDRVSVVIALFLVAAASWLFLELADEIVEGEQLGFDRQILLSLRTEGDPNDPIGPSWFEEMVRDITALGSTAILCLLVFLVCAFLLLTRKKRDAIIILLASVTGMLVSFTLKRVIARPRPDLVAHQMEVITLSFPSGHSLLSAVVFLSIGTIVSQSQPRQRAKTFVIATAITLSVLVGMSRVYLGVHWPSDVLAGWSVGSAWAILWWLIARSLAHRQERREAESSSATADGGAPEAGSR